MNPVSPLVKFSYEFSKGSVKDRHSKANFIEQKIFKDIMQIFKKKYSCEIDTFEKAYNDALPEGKVIAFDRIKDKYIGENFGELEVFLDDFDNITSFQMNLLGDGKTIKKRAIPTIMHETRHLLDYMLNPKILANDQLMSKRGLYDSDIIDFYENYIYNFEKMHLTKNKKEIILKDAEDELRSILGKMVIKDKIIALKYLKNQIITEYNAHVTNQRYAKILKNSRCGVSPADLHDGPEGYMFKEKLNMVCNILKEVISSQRRK